MGEGSVQQLIVVVLFAVFGLLEFAARWARRRAGEPMPPELPAAASARVEQEDLTVPQPSSQPVALPTSRSPARDTGTGGRSAPAERDRARKLRERLLRERLALAREATVRSAPARPRASRTASVGMSALERLRGTVEVSRRRTMFTAADARRGIIAQTVLGQCRGLDVQ